jgi:homoserine kinase
MKQIKLLGPATSANVGPGYDIFAMALNEPYDEMLLTLDDSNDIRISFDGEDQDISCVVEENAAGLAALEFKKRTGLNFGVSIIIKKNMVSGCGLGTTGASAASVVYGLNKLLNTQLSGDRMVDIARMGEIASGGSPHADNVASALLGGFTLVKSYQPLQILRIDMPEFPVVLAVIKKSQRSTRGLITYDIGQEKLKEQMSLVARVISAVHTKNIEEFGKAISTDHIAEPVRSAVIENYQPTKQKVLQAGAYGSTISGGGSSVITVCSEKLQDEIAEIMYQGLHQNPNFVKIIKTTLSNSGVREANAD